MFGFIQIPMSTEWLQYGRDGAFCDKRVKSRKNNMKISMCTHKLQVDVTLNTFVALFSVRSILFGVRQRYPRHSHILDYCLLFVSKYFCHSIIMYSMRFCLENFHIFYTSFDGGFFRRTILRAHFHASILIHK